MKIVTLREAPLVELSEYVPEMGNLCINDIGMGEWQVGSDHDQLITTGIGACLGLVAYNAEERLGLLGHFSDVNTENSQYGNRKDFLEAVESIGALGLHQCTTVWIGGVRPVNESIVTEANNEREFAERKVIDHFRSNDVDDTRERVFLDWSPHRDAVDLGLSCEKGILVVHRMHRDYIPR